MKYSRVNFLKSEDYYDFFKELGTYFRINLNSRNSCKKYLKKNTNNQRLIIYISLWNNNTSSTDEIVV